MVRSTMIDRPVFLIITSNKINKTGSIMVHTTMIEPVLSAKYNEQNKYTTYLQTHHPQRKQ